jgi:hypothetical protein
MNNKFTLQKGNIMKKIGSIILLFTVISPSIAQITVEDKNSGTTASMGLFGTEVKQGKEISQDIIDTFVIGTTTYKEIISKLGEPSSEQSLKGISVISYNSSKGETKIDPIKFIPIVGSLFGSTKIEGSQQSISFTFDADKILIDIKDMSTKGGGEDKGLVDKLRDLNPRIGR